MEEAVLVNVTTLDFPFSSVMISSSPKYFWNSSETLPSSSDDCTRHHRHTLSFCWLGHWQWFVHCLYHEKRKKEKRREKINPLKVVASSLWQWFRSGWVPVHVVHVTIASAPHGLYPWCAVFGPTFCEPVRPSGKAEEPRLESASALLSLQKLWSVDTVLWLCPSQLWNIKMALIAAHLNAQVILVVTV